VETPVRFSFGEKRVLNRRKRREKEEIGTGMDWIRMKEGLTESLFSRPFGEALSGLANPERLPCGEGAEHERPGHGE